MDQLTLEALRYHRWANLTLLDVCAGMSDAQLQMTAPGTYGTIASTFQHLLAAEQRYITRLGGPEPRLTEDSGFPGVAGFREHAARSGDELIAIGARLNADETIVIARRSSRDELKAWVVMVQAIHHGNDHRTHICTILGHHRIPYTDMDVWAYGSAVGAIVESAEPEPPATTV